MGNAYPSWRPTPELVEGTNVAGLMRRRGLDTYEALHSWSIDDRAGFWETVIEELGIVFASPPDEVLDDADPLHPTWLRGARLNIALSCFTSRDPEAVAVVAARAGRIERVTYGELEQRVRSAAAGLEALGYGSGVRVAIAMPMTLEAVVAYLAVVWLGGAVVSIADSFAADEIRTRLEVTATDVVVTQDAIVRSGKRLPMYDKVVAADARRCIVVGDDAELQDADVAWHRLESDRAADPHIAGPDATTNILFSSGTTGTPKAIPWSQLTPIKAAMDARYHHDIQPTDVVAWPTNLGWMMGPWLIYASLVNGAAMALYDDVPTDDGFGRFVSDAGVTMLGVVPSLVSAWRASRCMEELDWSAISRFSSTGEASNPDDMAYLMGLAGHKPVIEYCGGTEIGGGYVAGTMVQEAIPSTFTTPALGLDLVILDGDGREADAGEVFLVPPSIGLSSHLLNRDHDAEYHDGTPTVRGRQLRRHGDQMERLAASRFRAHGRVDDTMNLGGIKVSSAEIERAIADTDGVEEVAAVAVAPPGGGPSRLVVYAVLSPAAGHDPADLRRAFQGAIRSHLNPLFKVDDVVVVSELPRTASAKVMRRELRSSYEART